MSHTKLYIGLAAIIVLLGGFGYILYADRPVMKMEDKQSNVVMPDIKEWSPPTAPPAEHPPQEETTSDSTKTYAMTDVAAHASVDSCWSAINGSVYDLTTWIDRHPGGPERISGLCGKDGTAKFTMKHSGAPRPQAMLVLLKIGMLK
jgi:cytochrome b involved in lipid metabolism